MQGQNSREYFKSIKIVFFSLLVGQLTFALIALYLNLGSESVKGNVGAMRNIFLIIALIFALNGLLTGNMIYRSRLRKVIKNPSLSKKLSEYRSTLLIRLAMLEASTLFSLVAYLLTADLIFVGFAGMTLAYFVFLNPRKETIAFDLELNPDEKAIIESPEGVIVESGDKDSVK